MYSESGTNSARPGNSSYIPSVTTFDIRLTQAKGQGSLPPASSPCQHGWAYSFGAQWAIFLVLLYLNWKYALVLFAVKFVLKVFPVLEVVGEYPDVPPSSRVSISAKAFGGLTNPALAFR